MNRCAIFFLLATACAAPSRVPQAAAPGVPATVYPVEDVDIEPRPTNPRVFGEALARTYPRRLRDAGVTGHVVVRFRVDASGVPHDISIVRSTDPQFDRPTIDAVRLLRFTPAMLGGRRVEVWTTQPVEWRVQGLD